MSSEHILTLEQELQRIQNEVGHHREFDVHRGRGQGIKNLNARFYTPMICSRAMEYRQVNEVSRTRREERKRCIAIEILMELARLGGRIRAVDNTTPLRNSVAIRKVMKALKDRSREHSRHSLVPQTSLQRESTIERLTNLGPFDYRGMVETLDLRVGDDVEATLRVLESGL